MKFLFITLLVLFVVKTQAAADPYDQYRLKVPHYKDDVNTELKNIADENSSIDKSLNQHIHEKKVLIHEGEVHNKEMTGVTANVESYDKDLTNEHKRVESFTKSAKDTRKDWTGVKNSQVKPPSPPPVAIPKKATKAQAKKFLKNRKKVVAKKLRARRLQKMRQKTLETVNEAYKSQVDTIEAEITKVIEQIKIVYQKAERDDKQASNLQVKETAKMTELRAFMTHLLEYIRWTQHTMRTYHKLFKTRPDNVFLKKARRLEARILEVL